MGYKNLSLPKRTHRSRGNSILLGLGQLLYRYTLYDYEDGQTVLKDIWISGRTFECQYNGEWVTFKAY